jgi:hypothetical protein
MKKLVSLQQLGNLQALIDTVIANTMQPIFKRQRH